MAKAKQPERQPKTTAKVSPAKKPAKAPAPAPKKKRASVDPATSTRWHVRFLKLYGETGMQTEAMRRLKIDLVLLRRHRRQYPKFDQAVKEVREMVLDSAEDEAFRRGKIGVEEPVIYKGELSMAVNAAGKEVPLTVTKYSDSMLTLVLQAGRPEKFRQNVKVQVDDLDAAIAAALADLAKIEEDSAS